MPNWNRNFCTFWLFWGLGGVGWGSWCHGLQLGTTHGFAGVHFCLNALVRGVVFFSSCVFVFVSALVLVFVFSCCPVFVCVDVSMHF